MNRRTIPSIAAIAALVFTVAACGDDNDEPQPLPETSTSPSEPESSEPTDDPSAWTSDYTKQQIIAFDNALRRFEEYERKSEPIFAKGKATNEAKELFQDYFPSPNWRVYWQRLQTYEQVNVKLEGLSTIYWSKPKTISEDGTYVEIVQCVDYSSGRTTQDGEPVEVRDWAKTPRRRVVELDKPEGFPWLINRIQDPSTLEKRPGKCTP